ncbi:MAG: phosphoserine phosphatase RsbU/P [Acidobacteriaceae bacterium]|jgi:serine phosphatase RsbU (regulator of sigma subunit)|nr:phosphoserine phosphatase RsbU/P [Acidobacteriaceae bacterium]
MESSVAGSAMQVSASTPLPVVWSQFKDVDLHARHHSPCRGGDFFDALSVGQHVLFLLTDIAGLQLQAREVALQVQYAFRQKAQELFAGSDVNESDALAELAHAFNLAVLEAAQGVRFAPTFLGCFNLTHGIFSYCNAGNLLALVRSEGNVRVLESSGMPLGLFSHTTFEATILALQPGDAVLVVTKGVTGSRRGATDFGVERVERMLKDATAASASAICEALLCEAHDFSHHPWSRFLSLFHKTPSCITDDLTALALVRR